MSCHCLGNKYRNRDCPVHGGDCECEGFCENQNCITDTLSRKETESLKSQITALQERNLDLKSATVCLRTDREIAERNVTVLQEQLKKLTDRACSIEEFQFTGSSSDGFEVVGYQIQLSIEEYKALKGDS